MGEKRKIHDDSDDDNIEFFKREKGDDPYDTYEIEPDRPHHLLKMNKDNFKINDRILVNPNNQYGMKLYRVCKDKNNCKEKDVKLIREYDFDYSDEEDEYEEDNHDDVDQPKTKKPKQGGKKNKSNKQRKSKKGGKTRKSKKGGKTRKNRK